MKVYFACSMRGGQQNTGSDHLKELTKTLLNAGFDVLTTHTTDENSIERDNGLDDTHIYERDKRWIEECAFMVAEISNPSLGVGAEISDAITLEKPVIGMFFIDREKVSKYICGKLECAIGCKSSNYNDLEDFTAKVKEFSKTVS